MPLKKAHMHLSRNHPFSNKTNLHLELPGFQKPNPKFAKSWIFVGPLWKYRQKALDSLNLVNLLFSLLSLSLLISEDFCFFVCFSGIAVFL